MICAHLQASIGRERILSKSHHLLLPARGLLRTTKPAMLPRTRAKPARGAFASAATCLLASGLSQLAQMGAATTTRPAAPTNLTLAHLSSLPESKDQVHLGAKLALSVLGAFAALVAASTLLDQPAAQPQVGPSSSKRKGCSGRARGLKLAYELLFAFSLRRSLAHIFQLAAPRSACRQPARASELLLTCCAHCHALGPRSRLSSLSNVSEHSSSSSSASSTTTTSSTAALTSSSSAHSAAYLCAQPALSACGLLDSAKWSACSIRRAHYKPPVGLPKQTGSSDVESIDSLHGLKFFSMIWVIILHSYDFAWRWSFFANADDFEGLYKSSVGQLLANGSFACDSFFFATGFLLAFFAFPAHQANEANSSTFDETNLQHESELTGSSAKQRPAKLISNLLYSAKRSAEKQEQNINESANNKSQRLNQLLSAPHRTSPLSREGAPMTLKQVLENSLHRYIRMVPLMMAIIGLSATLLRYLGNGPAWESSTIMFDKWCRHNWWINSLFLHNFLDRENMCLSHSWYSAVDMQLFLAGQLVLYVLTRSRKLGLTLLLSMLVGAQTITAILTMLYQLPAVPLALNTSELSLNLYYGQIYIKPYCRASPYMVGMLLAYLMRTTWLGRARLSQWQVVVGWTCSIATILAILLATQPAMNGQPVGELEAALYSSLARTLWACAVGWMVFACITEHGGIFNSLLSAPLFVPFSRLTYPAFLIHPIVIVAFYGSRPMSFQFSNYLMFYLIVGNIVITYACALILSSLFELPLMRMEKIFKRKLQSNERKLAGIDRNPA